MNLCEICICYICIHLYRICMLRMIYKYESYICLYMYLSIWNMYLYICLCMYLSILNMIAQNDL